MCLKKFYFSADSHNEVIVLDLEEKILYKYSICKSFCICLSQCTTDTHEEIKADNTD